MLYKQTHDIDEYKHGRQRIIFAVSDTYEEFFDDEVEGIETDIFALRSIKQDLNTEEGSFAVDELSFEISSISCQRADDINAMFFCLNATDINFNRYAAVFFGEMALENMLFIGKIEHKVSGSDIFWTSSEYGYQVNPESVYKFSALSFDISIIKKCLLTGLITLPDGTTTDNVYQRLGANDWASIKAIFKNRDAYPLVVGGQVRPAQFVKLGSLYKTLQLYLDLARDIVFELTGTDIEFRLLEGSLGMRTVPVKYELINNISLAIKKFENDKDRIKELRFANADSGDDWSVPFIHRRIIDTAIGMPLTVEEVPKFINDYQANDAAIDNEYSFKSLSDVAEILYEVARAFACYIFASHQAGNRIDFEFRSREGLIEDDYTYIQDVTDSQFDTSSIISKDGNQFFGNANNYAIDGDDTIFNVRNTGDVVVSKDLQTRKLQVARDKEKNGIDSRRLMLTTSPTKLHLSASNTNYYYPLNILGQGITGFGNDNGWDYSTLVTGGGYPADARWNKFIREYLHTALYVKSTVSETEFISHMSTNPVWRPGSQILVNINGENRAFNTLSDYCNFVMARDVQYYETEYQLKVPFWNGFSKSADGSDAKWSNVKLGSKIKLYRNIRRYVAGEWEDVTVNADFIVVGKEINLVTPETTLKLHSVERFAFGTWDGGNPPPYSFTPDTTDEPFEPSVVSETLQLTESVQAGDAVQILPDKTLQKAVNVALYYHYPVAIALQDGDIGDVVAIQRDGIVSSANYNFVEGGKPVYLRRNEEGSNVSLVPLEEEIEGEDMVVMLGRSDGPGSFELDVWRAKYE